MKKSTVSDDRINVAMKYFIIVVAFGILFYTRFVNLSWGLPYPFHPDERNMAAAMQHFNCDQMHGLPFFAKFPTCLNPHFFAYGQFPLYLGYAMILVWHWFQRISFPMSFDEAVMSLRLISAISSILTAYVLIKIVEFVSDRLFEKHITSKFFQILAALLIFTFSPVLIQFAHFGTTESLLILFYVVLIYLSLKVLQKHDFLQNYLLLSGIICGLAIATKLSSLVYCVVPFYCVLHESKSIGNIFTRTIFRIVALARFTTIVFVFGLILSPYSLIELQEFYGSFKYESSVALGSLNVFYTRQFFLTKPILFQIQNIFPYTLGYGVFILFILGFLLLPWKNRYINLLRVSFLLVFLPNAYVYAKWTRFIAPAYPIMLLISVIFLLYSLQKVRDVLMKIKNYEAQSSDTRVLYGLAFLLCIICSIPGIAFLSIYQNQDVRFKASDWIYKNIPAESYILAETANVVDIPIPSREQLVNYSADVLNHYQYKSFNYYDLDTEYYLQEDLVNQMAMADYIFVPSRRIFANHTCYEIQDTQIVLQKFADDRCLYRLRTYPLLNRYYKELFTGESGFVQIAEFSAYPSIKLFGMILVEFPDENAEETWTVFDHPVIRIYKRI